MITVGDVGLPATLQGVRSGRRLRAPECQPLPIDPLPLPAGPQVPDPIIQLSCLDASLAMRPVFAKYQSVVITSGTLSPLDLYPRILSFNPVCLKSLDMTLTRQDPAHGGLLCTCGAWSRGWRMAVVQTASVQLTPPLPWPSRPACRECLCPVVLTRGTDQLPVSTKFDMRNDPQVVRNYGESALAG